MPAWRVLVWFKFTEMVLQCRPKALYRTFLNPDRGLRQAMRWYSQMGRRVWRHEIISFLRDPLERAGPTLAQFWGDPQDAEEVSMAVEASKTTEDLMVRRPPPRRAPVRRSFGDGVRFRPATAARFR